MIGYIVAVIGGFFLGRLSSSSNCYSEENYIRNTSASLQDIFKRTSREINKEYDFSGTDEACKNNKKIWGRHFPWYQHFFLDTSSMEGRIWVMQMADYRAEHIRNIKYLENHPGIFKDKTPEKYTKYGLYDFLGTKNTEEGTKNVCRV